MNARSTNTSVVGGPDPLLERATAGDLNRTGVLEAELDRYRALTERMRVETTIRQQQADHRIRQAQNQGEVDNRIREKRVDAAIEGQNSQETASAAP